MVPWKMCVTFPKLVLDANPPSQMVFLIDLPKKSPDSTDETPTAFREELQYFMTASGMPEKLVDKITQYDFSKTADMAFVHSM